MGYTEQYLQDALAKCRTGRSSIRKAAQELGVPTGTIKGRLKGHRPRSIGAESLQIFTPEQETHIVGWVGARVGLGFPPTHEEIRALASHVLEAQGASRTAVGQGWINRLLRRNPNIFDKKEVDLADLRGENEALAARLGHWRQSG